MKSVDISIDLEVYVKARIEYKLAEDAFDNADVDTVDDALTQFEKAEENLATIACKIVDSLVDST